MADPDWREAVAVARNSVSDHEVDAARRALDYLCLAQLYLQDNPRLVRPLQQEDIKASPQGHWGVCPPVNLVLAALGPLQRATPPGGEIIVVHGAGHAGPSALAHAYLTGRLGQVELGLTPSVTGLTRLLRGFAHPERFGGEITPLIPGHHYMGGQLGPALPVAHGMALDAPGRLVVALIGDGECETGATAAAWLGARALAGTGEHGRVLPLVLLNGERMGGPSLLAGLGHDKLAAHLAGLGYQALIADGRRVSEFRDVLSVALSDLEALHDGPSTLLVLTLPKGFGVPDEVAGVRLAGTPRVHKTPLLAPRDDLEQFIALGRWLAGYRPTELIQPDGTPSSTVASALPTLDALVPPSPQEPEAPRGCLAASTAVARSVAGDFSTAITATLITLHRTHGLRVFSPDELTSNRVRLGETDGSVPWWVVEILNEELCHAWAQGYTETGRRSLIIGYEAFAPVATSLLIQQLKYRSAARAASRPAMPSIVYLLTSLGWNNTFTHANPGLVTSALASGDPTVHVFTPADAARAAACLTFAVRKLDCCSLVVADKYPNPLHLLHTVEDELRQGYAVWPHLSDPGPPDLVLLAAGDIAARELATAAEKVHAHHPGARLRFVAIHDLTCLGHPDQWPAGIPEQVFADLFPASTPVLAATVCGTEPLRILLWDRPETGRFHLRGYTDPGRPVSASGLLQRCRIDATSLADDALALVCHAEAGGR